MTEDLSRYHAPLSDLFPTGDWVRFYNANGYLAGIRMLNETQLDVLRRELAELVDPAHPGIS